MQSSIEGKGMFAIEDIREGETIVIWGDGYTDRLGAEKAKRGGKGTMQWDDDLFSCETGSEIDQEPYAINHSCDPNAGMSDAFTIVAMKNIGVDEEVTMDYVLFWEADEEEVSEWECRCGSPLCRGRLTGKDWQDSELQKRYLGYFSPLIRKRIEHVK